MRPLNEDVRLVRASNAVAAGSTDSNGTGVDMQADGGYDGVMFVALLGTLTANQVTTLKAQVSSDDGSSDTYADLANSQTSAAADDDDNQCLVLDVYQPPERYVRPVVERATANAVIDGVLAILYRGRSKPSTHDATTIITSLICKQQAEGTA